MSRSSPHLAALCAFMFLTGARSHRGVVLDLDQVDFQCTSTDPADENLHRRRAHLPTELVAALANIPGPREGRVFGYASRQSCDRSWRRACVRAGIEVLSFHPAATASRRNCCAAGVDVVTVAKSRRVAQRAQVLATYGHALDDLTLTDRLVNDEILTPNEHSDRPKEAEVI